MTKGILAVVTAATLSLWFAAAPARAQEERGSSFFCIAEDTGSNTYIHSQTFKADPGTPTDAYESSWRDYLKTNGLPENGGCTFTNLPENVPTYLDGLKQQCDDCSVWSLREVSWSYEPGKPAAAKDHSNLATEMCDGFTEENYREKALADGPDEQLRSLCGQAFEYYTMYKRALAQGYSEADAERTYQAHEKSVAVLKQFYEETRTDR
jgi:hypothetical protein